MPHAVDTHYQDYWPTLEVGPEDAATLHSMAFVFADLYGTDEVLALLG